MGLVVTDLLKITKFLVFMLVLVAFTVGCDTPADEECRADLSAIASIHRNHLKAHGEIDPSAFRNAGIILLSQHKIRSSEELPEKIEAQCKAIIEKAHKADPGVPIKDLHLELLNNYVHELDPHSVVASQLETWSALVQDGFGFLVERSHDTGFFEITDVIAGSPAHSAGLIEGMVIERVNNQDVRELSNAAVRALLRNSNFDHIQLKIRGSSSEYDLEKETISISPVKTDVFQMERTVGTKTKKTLTESIAYLKIRNFYGAKSFVAEILRNTMKPSSALIVDLRNNQGGEIQDAADIANLLISHAGAFVGFIGKDQSSVSQILKLKHLSSVWDGPIVVLVNSTTKSSAEILAGALQDYGAVVVGTTTFGKGTRQTKRSLGELGIVAGCYVTDAFTVRPSGKLIQFQGVTPDVILNSEIPLKKEGQYAHAIQPPYDSKPLPGYDASMLPMQSKLFRTKLEALTRDLQNRVERLEYGSREDEQQLEVAKQVALFLVTEN